MATIIDGRGNISRKSETSCKNIPEEIIEEPKTMTIEEYRNLELTPEQEWNNTYNPKRSSIEALNSIQIKKRGKGPDKKIFYPGCKEPGPYYDPSCFHVHIWKKRENVENFIGEQFQNVPYIQFTDNKPGLYCTICHAKNKQVQFKWKQTIEEEADTPNILQNTVVYKKEDYLSVDKIKVFPNTQPKEKPLEINNRVLTNWNRVANRVLHSLYNNKIVYPLSNFKSLYLWPWQLTPYQKFKLNNPSYNISSNIFVKSENSRFQKNYAVVV